MRNIFLSVIVPTYNEEKRIGLSIKKLKKYLFNAKYDYEVIFVDDGSCDKTSLIIKKQIDNLDNFKLINYSANQGKGYAVRRGMMAAKGKYILFMDADMSTPIEEIGKLMTYIEKYPIVIGSRYLRESSIKVHQSFTRRIISRWGNSLIRQILKLPYQDTQCGFKLFHGEVAKKIFSRAQINHWGFDIEILAMARILHYRVKEVPVDWYHDAKSQVRAGRAAWHTFQEVIKIKNNIKSGIYH